MNVIIQKTRGDSVSIKENVTGTLLSESSEKVALFYSLSGLFLSLMIFMNGMIFAGSVAALSAAGGGIALILFGGVDLEK